MKLLNCLITSGDNGIVIIFYKDTYLLKIHVDILWIEMILMSRNCFQIIWRKGE